MRALVTRLRADHTREKGLVTDWPEPEEPQDREIKTRTLYTGITNGTDHNHLVGGTPMPTPNCQPAGAIRRWVGSSRPARAYKPSTLAICSI